MKFLELFSKPALIAAHRGSHTKSPENSMSAVLDSIGRCDYIELDIQLSRDRVPIIIHDDTLERTTNVSELDKFFSLKPYLVCDFSYDELKELEYGENEPLFTLKSALKVIKEEKLFVNLEIKDIHEHFSDEVVVDIVLKHIKSFNIEDHVLISSFRHEYLKISKERSSDILTAALVENHHPKDLINYLKSLKVDAYNMDDSMVDKKIVSKLKKAGFIVNVYTVNDNSRAKELFKMGINSIFTDKLLKKVQ